MAESTQHKLDRVRPPRVQITYDVEIGGAIEKKELPLVVGILADLSGDPPDPALPKLGERRFVSIDRDNFNKVLASLAPRTVIQVDNKLGGDGKLSVELSFSSIDEFDPDKLVEKYEPLHRLFKARQRLRDLLTKLDGNNDLESELQTVAANNGELQEAKSSGATAKSDYTNGSAKPDDTNGSAKPDDTSISAKPNDTSGSAKPDDTSGSAKPDDTSGSAKPDDTSGSAKPDDTSGSAKPDDTSGSAKPNDTSGSTKP